MNVIKLEFTKVYLVSLPSCLIDSEIDRKAIGQFYACFEFPGWIMAGSEEERRMLEQALRINFGSDKIDPYISR